jgi:hypothetical protein
MPTKRARLEALVRRPSTRGRRLREGLGALLAGLVRGESISIGGYPSANAGVGQRPFPSGATARFGVKTHRP